MQKMDKLQDTFIGSGEVKGFLFKKIFENEHAYIYSVEFENNNHFEVFEKRTVPLCIDFEKRIYSTTNFKEAYPKANDFGIWAWTFKYYENALIKAKEIDVLQTKI